MGLSATTWVPLGAQVPVLSLNQHPKPSQWRRKGFRQRRSSEILHVSLNSLHDSNSGAFGGGMARAIWAWWPLRGSPWVLKYPYCHEIITQTHPRGDTSVLEKGEFRKPCKCH